MENIHGFLDQGTDKIFTVTMFSLSNYSSTLITNVISTLNILVIGCCRPSG